MGALEWLKVLVARHAIPFILLSCPLLLGSRIILYKYMFFAGGAFLDLCFKPGQENSWNKPEL